KIATEFKDNITFRTDENENNGIYLQTYNLTKMDSVQFLCILEVYVELSDFISFKMEPIVDIK
ncbi:hypothetical protein BgiBS90_013045, partial [Biomphalaria glabrata]